MKKCILNFILIMMAPFVVTSQTNDSNLDVEKIVKHIDELYRSESSYSELEMDIVTPHWERTLKMKAWSKGMDRTFIRILSPAKEEGVATLRIGNEMWNYLPKTNKVIKIPPSMMMGSWMGSDFTNDDLVREFTWLKDYNFKLIEPEDADKKLLYIQLIPKENLPIVWGKIVVAARRMDYIPVWEKYYDEKDKLMRVMNFKDIKTFDNKKIPSVMELITESKKGNKTVIRYIDVNFNANVSQEIFSLRNLRSRR